MLLASLHNVTKRYSVNTVLKDVSFQISSGQKLGLIPTATVPNRADGMDNALRLKIPSAGDNGLSRRQPALPGDNLPALHKNGRPASTMNGTIDTASTHQAGIGCVDYGVSGLCGDVPLNER